MKNFFNFRGYINFLGRNKLFTLINIFGFAVSLVFVILLSLYIRQELSVDKFHEKVGRIYRAEGDAGANFAPPIAGDLKSRYPEVESTVRIIPSQNKFVNDPEGNKINADILLADSTFFTVFSFPMVDGRPADMLKTRQDIVLTQTFARKVFGDRNPVGESLVVNDETYIVGGVAADFRNTHFSNPDIIVRFEKIADFWGSPKILEEYYSAGAFIYLLTYPNTDLGSKRQEIADHFRT